MYFGHISKQYILVFNSGKRLAAAMLLGQHRGRYGLLSWPFCLGKILVDGLPGTVMAVLLLCLDSHGSYGLLLLGKIS
jgi:hypothetical protein